MAGYFRVFLIVAQRGLPNLVDEFADSRASIRSLLTRRGPFWVWSCKNALAAAWTPREVST
jgi:hypothetical protein